MVSKIGDSWAEQFQQKWPNINPPPLQIIEMVPRSEFDALRRGMEELKKLLVAAKKFDDATGQPECQMDEKVRLIKQIAKLVGVDLGSVFEPPKPA